MKKIACLPTKHIGVHMNSFKRVREFQIELELEVLVFEETGKPEYPEKNLSEQGWEPTTNLPIGLPYSLSRQKRRVQSNQ